MAQPSTMLQLSTAMMSVRCPNPHRNPEYRRPCNHLLLCYDGTINGSVSVKCPSCRNIVVLAIASTGA